MGIHGEPGREQRELPDKDNAAVVVADILCEGILGSTGPDPIYPPRLILQNNDDVAVLLNNLGALPAIEMLVVAKSVILNLRKRGFNPVRAFVGPYVTALDMNGISLSLLKVTDKDILDLIDYPTHAPAWVKSSVLTNNNNDISQSIPYDENVQHVDVRGGFPCPSAITVVKAICEKIIEIESKITEYDTICGDGDCGLVMKAGALKILSDLKNQEVR